MADMDVQCPCGGVTSLVPTGRFQPIPAEQGGSGELIGW